MALKPKASPAIPTLGVIELGSVARGLVVCDAMLKKADVRVLRASPVGCGKFIVILTGSEADLDEAVNEGIPLSDPYLVGSTYIPNIHTQVVEALTRKNAAGVQLDSFGALDALGILEARSLSSTIRAADLAVKTGEVRLIELTYDLDLGGKAYFTLTGELSEVEAALGAAQQQVAADGAAFNSEIIARPHDGMHGVVIHS